MSEDARSNSVAAPAAGTLDGQRPSKPALRHEDEHAMPADLPRVSGWGIAAIVIVLAVLFAAMFFAGWIPHQRRLAAAETNAHEAGATKLVVEMITPRVSSQDESITLPGDVGANQMTAVFARTGGYLKPLPPGIDIGAKVQEGQLIAEIAAPEVDAQLAQARASVDQARAAVTRADEEHALAASTLKRYESPSLGLAIAQLDLDTKRSQERVAASALNEAGMNVAVAEAAVERLAVMQRFEKVVAPFAGIITTRGYDVGALISATDSGGGMGRELFMIAQVDPLRVEVKVPQTYATGVHPGQSADLLVRNFPGQAFPGAVARSTGAIDAATRTLRVQIDVPNAEGKLMPGMYGEVRIRVHRDQPVVIVPTSALLFGADGVKVAVLDGGRVHFRLVSLGRDFGVDAEVLTGLAQGEAVVNNPGTLVEGMEVTKRGK